MEAYPDVANNYVQVITQWPGRAAEEVEQQVTTPIEIVDERHSAPGHLRSFSVFGLSSVMLIFDDQSTTIGTGRRCWNGCLKSTAGKSATADWHRLQPGGTDLLVHAEEHESEIRPDGAEVDRGLDAGEAFKSVPDVVDVVALEE